VFIRDQISREAIGAPAAARWIRQPEIFLDRVAHGSDDSSISVKAQNPNRKLFLWPMAAIVLGAFAAVNPFYQPDIPPFIGYTAWIAVMALAIACFVYPPLARPGVLLCGLFLAVPCFLDVGPLFRVGLICLALLPLLMATTPLLAPSITDLRPRLYFLMSWFGTRELKRCPRSFHAAALLQSVAGTLAFAGLVAAVQAIPASGLWFGPRWLAGGLMIFAFAEAATGFHNFLTALLGLTVPGLMNSPVLSRSIGEFWTERWNPGASVYFRKACYEPLARHGRVRALFAAFIVSGIWHWLLAYVVLGRWGMSVVWGAFFFVQPLLILLERRMKVRRWRPAAARGWTLSALAVTCPLIVEPMLQIFARILEAAGPVPWTAAMVVLVVVVTVFPLAVSLMASSPSIRGHKTNLKRWDVES
jgi:hypothetical protein